MSEGAEDHRATFVTKYKYAPRFRFLTEDITLRPDTLVTVALQSYVLTYQAEQPNGNPFAFLKSGNGINQEKTTFLEELESLVSTQLLNYQVEDQFKLLKAAYLDRIEYKVSHVAPLKSSMNSLKNEWNTYYSNDYSDPGRLRQAIDQAISDLDTVYNLPFSAYSN